MNALEANPEFITSREVEGNGMAKTLDFSCRTPCLCRQDGICKHTQDYPRCQLQERASKFATSKGRASATHPPKSSSQQSRAGSAGSHQVLPSHHLQWSLGLLGTVLRQCCFHFYLSLEPAPSLFGTIHRV